jgi:hypothetical protein
MHRSLQVQQEAQHHSLVVNQVALPSLAAPHSVAMVGAAAV